VAALVPVTAPRQQLARAKPKETLMAAKSKDLTVEEAIAASRAALKTPSPAEQEFLQAALEPTPEPTPEPEEEDLDAKLDAAFAALDGGKPAAETEAKLDPDGTFTFNLDGLPDNPDAATRGPLVLSDEAPVAPPVDDEAGASDYEEELPFDWDAGREALARHR
jgi:hypothetical protein